MCEDGWLNLSVIPKVPRYVQMGAKRMRAPWGKGSFR